MKKLLLLIILLLIIGSIVLLTNKNKGDDNINGNVVTENNGVQEVTIGMKDYNYYPREIRVKSDVPVRIILDDSVFGCFRAFTINELGVRKYSSDPSDVIEFTPTNPGKYRFACSMGMGYGTLIVEE